MNMKISNLQQFHEKNQLIILNVENQVFWFFLKTICNVYFIFIKHKNTKYIHKHNITQKIYETKKEKNTYIKLQIF